MEDYATYHPYSRVFRRPYAKPFPHGVSLGTTGLPTYSAASRLLDLEYDFPNKYERRAEINRLKSKRRLEAEDWGLLPYNSWSTYLKPSRVIPRYYINDNRDYYLGDYYPIVVSRYPVRPLRMVQLAPLSVRAIPIADSSLDALTLDIEAEEKRIQAQHEAKRIQSAVWQSEATDRAIKLCKDRNRIRNQLRRIDNARMLAPIYSSPGVETLGTRHKVLINYHKGAATTAHQDATHHTTQPDDVTVGYRPTKEHTDEEIAHITVPLRKPPAHEVITNGFVDDQEAALKIPAEEPQASFSVGEQQAESADEPSKKETKVLEAVEEETPQDLKTKPKREHKYERSRDKIKKQEKKSLKAENKPEQVAEYIYKEKIKVEPAVVEQETTVEPVVEEKKFEPIVEEKKKAEPVVEKEAEPVVEKEAEPVVEKEAEPVVEKEAEPVVEKEAEPIVEEEKVAKESSDLPEEQEEVPQTPEPPTEERQNIIEPVVKEPESESFVPDEEKLPDEPPTPDVEYVLVAEREESIPVATVPVEPPDQLITDESEQQSQLDFSETSHPEPQPVNTETESEGTEQVQNEPLEEEPISEPPLPVKTQVSTDETSEKQHSETETPFEETVAEEPTPSVTETDVAAEVESSFRVTATVVATEEEPSIEAEAAQDNVVEDEPDSSPTVLRRLVSNVSNLEGDACDESEWDDDEKAPLPSPKIEPTKKIILSASDDAIPTYRGGYDDDDAPVVTSEEPSTIEGMETVKEKEIGVDPSRFSAERFGSSVAGDDNTDITATTNENAEAGSAISGDNAEETLSANGRPLSIEADSLVADDENILDEVLETTYGQHDSNVEPHIEEPDDETEKYDDND